MKTRLTALCPAKINLFLHITGHRQDGYHLLESLFCPVNLADELIIDIEPDTSQSGLQITRKGPLAALSEDVDLTVRACHAFFQAAPIDPYQTLHIHVRKNIPQQAGLGGGSSNAAAVLRLLQSHYQQPLSNHALATLALQLGADVPFFLQSQSAFAQGIGEQLTHFDGLDHPIILVKPPQNCPTAEVFRHKELTRDSSPVKIAVFDSGQLDSSGKVGPRFWHFLRASTQNSLQKAVEQTWPDWAQLFKQFDQVAQKHEAVLCRMSGSGSAMFAVFQNQSDCTKAYESLCKLPGEVFMSKILAVESKQGSSV